MARIARLPSERSSLLPVEAFAVQTKSGRGERLAWGWGLGGLVIASGMYVRIEMAAGTLPDLTSSLIGRVPLVTIPVEPALLVLGLGLLLYLKGLFSPLPRAAPDERKARMD